MVPSKVIGATFCSKRSLQFSLNIFKSRRLLFGPGIQKQDKLQSVVSSESVFSKEKSLNVKSLLAAELKSTKAENTKFKNDLELKESDRRIYHSKYNECSQELAVLREQLDQLYHLAIEGTPESWSPDQSNGRQNELFESAQPVKAESTQDKPEMEEFWKDIWTPYENKNPPYENPSMESALEIISDADENGNRVSQFDQYETEDSPKLANPVNRTIKTIESKKRRLFDDGEESAPKKSVRKVLKFVSHVSCDKVFD